MYDWIGDPAEVVDGGVIVVKLLVGEPDLWGAIRWRVEIIRVDEQHVEGYRVEHGYDHQRYRDVDVQGDHDILHHQPWFVCWEAWIGVEDACRFDEGHHPRPEW